MPQLLFLVILNKLFKNSFWCYYFEFSKYNIGRHSFLRSNGKRKPTQLLSQSLKTDSITKFQQKLHFCKLLAFSTLLSCTLEFYEFLSWDFQFPVLKSCKSNSVFGIWQHYMKWFTTCKLEGVLRGILGVLGTPLTPFIAFLEINFRKLSKFGVAGPRNCFGKYLKISKEFLKFSHFFPN